MRYKRVDSLGLYFSCHDPDDLHITPVPTGYGADKSEGVVITMKPVGRNEVAFDPFPFRARNCRISLSVKRLPERKYNSAEAFRTAYFRAQTDSIVFTLI